MSGDCEENKKRKLTRDVLTLQDNAPAHTSQVAMAATKCSFKVLPNPPYSSELGLSDFFLFPILKNKLCGRQFGGNEV